MTEFTPPPPSGTIQDFIRELEQFAVQAEDALSAIEKNPDQNKALFSVLAEQMSKIRSSALQLNLPDIVHIAGLGEEIALKAGSISVRPQLRKCTGSLWDTLTTVKFLLQTGPQEQEETQLILINRLEKTLQTFGGPRPTLQSAEIAQQIRNKS